MDGLRDENGVLLGVGGYAGADVDGDPGDLPTADFTLSGVDARADRDVGLAHVGAIARVALEQAEALARTAVDRAKTETDNIWVQAWTCEDSPPCSSARAAATTRAQRSSAP